MTARERELLEMVRSDIKAGRTWIQRCCTPKATITWEEMKWLADFIDSATLTRIEAVFIVEQTTLAFKARLATRGSYTR